METKLPTPINSNPISKKIPYMLPEDFKVYVKNGIILNHWAPGFKEITLHTYNDYLGADGGYVAIYTRDPQLGLYSVGNEGGSTIYVMGQIRVQGYYSGRCFIPTKGDHFYRLGDNITRDKTILAACKKYLPEGMTSDFWIGGDTGGWFGIQLSRANRLASADHTGNASASSPSFRSQNRALRYMDK